MRTLPKTMILRRVVIVAAAMSTAVAVLAAFEVLIDDARRTAVVFCAVNTVVLNFTLKDVEGVGLIFCNWIQRQCGRRRNRRSERVCPEGGRGSRLGGGRARGGLCVGTPGVRRRAVLGPPKRQHVVVVGPWAGEGVEAALRGGWAARRWGDQSGMANGGRQRGGERPPLPPNAAVGAGGSPRRGRGAQLVVEGGVTEGPKCRGTGEVAQKVWRPPKRWLQMRQMVCWREAKRPGAVEVMAKEGRQWLWEEMG